MMGWAIGLREVAKADKRVLIGGGLVLLAILISAFAPVLSPYDPVEVFSGMRNMPPGTPGHILGTDQTGRDIVSRLIWGCRITLLMGSLPVLGAMVIGTFLGMSAAYFGGWFGWLVLRLMEVLFAFPLVLLAILAAQVLGKGMLNAMAAMSIVVIPYVIRAAHAATRATIALTFVEAAKVRGAGPWLVLWSEVLPNIFASLVVFAVSVMPIFVIFSAGLSYLGLAIEPPTPEWGIMIAEGQTVIQVAPHVPTIPGLFLLMLSVSLNVLGDGLQDVLDPRMARSGAGQGAGEP